MHAGNSSGKRRTFQGKGLGLLVVLGTLTLGLVLTSRAPALAQAWIPTGNLDLGRYWHTATLLQNGQVLVAGGQNAAGGAYAECEIYDPTAGTWTATGSLGTARDSHTATLLQNGQVLVAGGVDSDYSSLSESEYYDPTAAAWTAVGDLATARGYHTATLLQNGQVLVAGGFDSSLNGISTCEIYDPTAGTWSTTGSLKYARALHTATLLPNGQVLVAGGQENDSGDDDFSTCEIYDPNTGVWTETGILLTARSSHTATPLQNGLVLVAGGSSSGIILSECEIYDPATGAWSTTESLAVVREWHTANLLDSGQVLVAGGKITPSRDASDCELYDPSTGAWTATGSLPNYMRYWDTATLLQNGQVLVAGGFNGRGALSSCEIYGDFNFPGAPTAVTATAGDALATVNFTAPASDGNLDIISYPVTCSPGGRTASGTSPITVTGLTNGTSYTFTVTAVNAVGTGPASTPSNSMTPGVVPGSPTLPTAKAGNGWAIVGFKAPATSGGPAITGYTVTSSPGGITATGAGSPITVQGLTNGTAYRFRVTATNAIGAGPSSGASIAVIPATPPGVPAITGAKAGNAEATVSFTAPANGGAVITRYTVTSNPGGILAEGHASPVTIRGLTNGTPYTFTVTATNGIGTGSPSGSSNQVTPATLPGAPTGVTATPGPGQATVSFTPPSLNGGSPITSYTVTSSPGAKTASGTGSTITVTGLTSGTAYTFTVKATNGIGTGPASSRSNRVTPEAP